jgi:hypothetical protein
VDLKKELDKIKEVKKLKSSIKIHHFTDKKKAVDFIKKDLFNRRLLVISCGEGGQGPDFCEQIHHEFNVIGILVYCANLEKNEEWARNYFKIEGVFTNFYDLLRSISI